MGEKERIKHLRSLCDELSKDQPKQEAVRMLMMKAGLAYDADPVQQLSVTLAALDKEGRNEKRLSEHS